MSEQATKTKRAKAPDAPATPSADTISAEEARALRRQLSQTTALAHALGEQIELMRSAPVPGELLPPEEAPAYELTAPWYSPDDVYYPAGTRVEDLTGEIVPNEHMVPLNAAAEDRMVTYLTRLPTQGTPNLDHIIQAAMELRPREGEDPRLVADYHGRVLQRAMELKFKQEGKLAPEPGDRPRLPAKLPTRPGHVPIMPNTHIREGLAPGDRFGAEYRGRFMPGARAGARPTSTRMRSPAPSAAERAAPVLGTVASQPLGTVGPGTQAA